ncbi:MAG: kelch repeat-containing protein [Pseudomonadota bacterium]
MSVRRSTLVLYCAAIALAMAIDAGAQTPSSRWQSVAAADGSAPEARHEAAFSRVGEWLILAGGRGEKATNLFDPAYGRWRTGAAPPIELHHFQGVEVDGTLWAIGAFTGGYPDEKPLPNALIYDPESDQWREGPSVPADRRRGSAGTATADGFIYIAGGATDGHSGGHVAWLDRLDINSGEWTRLSDAPRARDHGALIAHNDKLYLLGGRLSLAPDNPFGAVVPEVDVYDIASDTWTTLSQPLPNPRAGIAAAILGDAIYVIGGESGATEDAYREVDRLDTNTGTWSAAPGLLRGRHGTGAAVLNNSIWVASGSGARGGGPELTDMERLALD